MKTSPCPSAAIQGQVLFAALECVYAGNIVQYAFIAHNMGGRYVRAAVYSTGASRNRRSYYKTTNANRDCHGKEITPPGDSPEYLSNYNYRHEIKATASARDSRD